MNARYLLAGLLIGLSLLCTTASAHPDWYLARIKPPNGGQLRNAGNFHLELVVTSGEIKLFVSDHFFNKFPTKNSSATAILIAAGKTMKVALEPGGDNLLHVTGAFPQDKNMRVGILLDAHRIGPVAARFVPFQPWKDLVPPAQALDPSIDPPAPEQ